MKTLRLRVLRWTRIAIFAMFLLATAMPRQYGHRVIDAKKV